MRHADNDMPAGRQNIAFPDMAWRIDYCSGDIPFSQDQQPQV